MQYVIHYLEPLIADCLSKKAISAGYVRTRIEELRMNLPQVKTKFISDAFAAKHKSSLKIYLNTHLKILITSVNALSGELAGEAVSKSPSALKISLLEHIQKHCISLIGFLRDTFKELISEKIPYTDAMSNSFKAQYKDRILVIEEGLTKNSLFQSVCTVLLETLEASDYKISPFTGCKWEDLINELENIQDDETLSYEQLTCLLIRHGFNARKCLDLICNHLDGEFQLIADPSEQRRLLCFLEKTFTQAVLSNRNRFFKDLPKLYSSILKYIRSEIRLLDLLKEADIGDIGNDPFLGSFTVSLSVKQLAFFVFLQVETGILLTKTAKQVHQYFANRFSTLEGGTISEKSFKNAYYSHSAEDILKVIDKLSQMLVIAEESY